MEGRRNYKFTTCQIMMVWLWAVWYFFMNVSQYLAGVFAKFHENRLRIDWEIGENKNMR